MKNLRCLLLCFLGLSCLCSGGDQAAEKADIVVVDKAGKPIKGASVEPVSLSINFGKLKTDKKGEVRLSRFYVQEIEWISVSYLGYKSKVSVQYRGEKKPVKVVLEKIR